MVKGNEWSYGKNVLNEVEDDEKFNLKMMNEDCVKYDEWSLNERWWMDEI